MRSRYMIHVFYTEGSFKTFQYDDPSEAIKTILDEGDHSHKIIVWDTELEEYLQ